MTLTPEITITDSSIGPLVGITKTFDERAVNLSGFVGGLIGGVLAHAEADGTLTVKLEPDADGNPGLMESLTFSETIPLLGKFTEPLAEKQPVSQDMEALIVEFAGTNEFTASVKLTFKAGQ